MDVCNPGINAKNLARLVRQETGVELNLNRNQICDVYKSIQDGKLPLPPMVLTKDGKYMLDRKSPLTSSDFEVLFSSSSKSGELKRVARKVGLSNYKDMTKSELVDAIENVLKSNNVREPIRLHITAPKQKRISVDSNNNYQNNFNVNNRNGNGVKNNNLKRISNESNNLGNRENVNRGNGNRENGNRENGNRGNGTPRPPNRTARNKYYMAAAARRVGGNGVQPSSTPSDPTMAGLINALRKSRNSSNTASLTRALERAKSGSSSTNTRALARQVENALKRGNATTLNALRKKLATPEVSEKDKKVAELEKYITNKGSKLNTQRRVTFMNDAQKSIKAYKNGTNIYNTAKTRITAAYETMYKSQLNDMGAQRVLEELQKTVNTIGNIKIKSAAGEKLNVFKQSGGADTGARNAVIKLKKLDEELGKKKVNRVYLNAVRDEALKNINSYNINNGLAKINTQVQQEKNKRGLEFNELIKNDTYKNIPSNIKSGLRNQYVSGEKKINDIKRDLNIALEETAGVFKGLENKIQNLETKLNNSKLTVSERNALKKERNNLKQRLNRNALNMNEMREQLGNMKTTINTKNRNVQILKKQKENANGEIKKLKNKLNTNKSLSNGEKTALQEQLNNAMKNRTNLNNRLRKSEAEKMQYMREMNALAENVRKQKENANAEIAELTKKLKNGSISNAERKKLENELAEARGNVLIKNEELQKLQKEKESFNAEIAKAKQNVEAARAAQSAANRNRNAQVANARSQANRLKSEANKARNAARAEARRSAEAAAAANAEAKRIAQQLEKANLTKNEMNALIKEKNALLETRQKEMQNQINAIEKQAKNKNNLISVLESNINAKNADLLKKIEQIKQTQSNVVRLQRDLNSEKATSAEKNKIKNQLQAETARLMREKEMLEGSRVALTQQRNQFKKQLNMAEGGRIALMNKLRQLQNTKNISNKQRNVFREQLRKVQAQRRNLRGGMSANRAQYATTQSQLDATQKNLTAARLNEQRAKQRIIEASRLTRNRASNTQNFNATKAFQNMGNKLTTNKNAWKRGVRGRWQNVARPGAAYLKNEENLRVAKNTLRTLINSKRPNGNYTIGGPFGQKRRQLKSELERVLNMTQLREIRKKIAAAKNIKNTEVAQKRMNKTLSMVGSSTNNFKFDNSSQPIATRGQLLTKNNRNNTKKTINSLFRIGNKTKLQLKRRINMGEKPKDVLRNAMSKNLKAGGPAAAARIRAQAYAS